MDLITILPMIPEPWVALIVGIYIVGYFAVKVVQAYRCRKNADAKEAETEQD